VAVFNEARREHQFGFTRVSYFSAKNIIIRQSKPNLQTDMLDVPKSASVQISLLEREGTYRATYLNWTEFTDMV